MPSYVRAGIRKCARIRALSKVQSTKFLSMERKVFWAQKTQILSLSQIFEISFNYFDIIVCISHNDNK